MKKVLTILALTITTSVFAQGVTMEFERERGTQSPNTMSNTIKVAPYIKFDNGVKADIMFAGSKDDGQVKGSNNPLENQIEARVQKMWEIGYGVKAGARVSVGEMVNGVYNSAGTSQTFAYYTIEPKASYGLTKDLSLAAAWRYRNSFNDTYAYQTRTWKVGADYALTKKDEIGARYLVKRGDFNSNGVELTYSRAF